MKLLSLEQVLQLHVLALLESGGGEGIRDLGRLESAVASQTQEAFGEILYESLHEKAAAMCRNIIGDHPFIDGNKRTGMLTALTLLSINGFKVKIKKGELEDFAVCIAVEKLDVPAIADWLKKHSTPV